MNNLNRNYVYRSTESEKKERKLKNHRTEEVCKCLPYVKFHYHDCPVVMKPCPIHGNNLHHNYRDSKLNPERNVIISFHPSSKTEKLLQPIKSILTHCNSDTKINFRYYSPENSINKENLKSQNGQNAYENIKRALNSNVFVEKTKSFVARKRNKVKKLKQCFHSPCNSIAQKTLSQTSIKAKINQILHEEKQTRNMFYNMVPEIPPDDKKFDSAKNWFYSKKSDFRCHDILSDEKLDSNFITVTRQDKNNTIHHKIYEIKHRKGLNNVPFVGFPKHTNNQLVYSAINVTSGGQKKPHTIGSNSEYTAQDRDDEENNVQEFRLGKSAREESADTGENQEVASSGKTNRSFSSSSSSSGSVYITPFIFVPKRMGESERTGKLDEAIQVDTLPLNETQCICKQMPPTQSSEAQTSKQPEPIQIQDIQEPKFKHTSSQTESEERHSTSVKEIFVIDDKVNNEEDTNRKSVYEEKFKDVGVQTSAHLYKEALAKTRLNKQVTDKMSQTDDDRRKSFRDKEVQIVQNQTEGEEFIELNSPNVTYVIRSFDRQQSDPDIDKLAKTWWGKSHSDSDLCERAKCRCCRSDNENLILQYDLNKASDLSNASGEKSTYTKFYESECITREVESGNPHATVVLTKRETIECFSETKQAPARDEDIAAAISDLTELTKIVQDFFEKGNFASKSNCDCNKAKQLPKTDTPRKTEKRIENKDTDVQKPETSNAYFQTTGIEPEKRNIDIQTSFPLKPEMTDQAIGIQESLEKSVQTNNDIFFKGADNSKLKNPPIIRRTVLVDENGTATYFVCALCGRDIKTSSNVATNTEINEYTVPQRKTRPLSPPIITKWEEPTHQRSSSNPPETAETRRDSPSKRGKSATGPKNYSKAEQPDYRTEKTWKPQNSPRGPISEKSRIPIPDPGKNTRSTARVTELLSQRSYYVRDWNPKVQTTTTTSQTQERSIIRTEFRDSPFELSDRGQEQDPTRSQKSKGTRSHKKSSTSGRKDSEEQRNSTDRKKRLSKNNDQAVYPVIITPIWPRNISKILKSMENPTEYPPSDDARKFSTIKQKRSYDKELDVTAAGKKLKMDAEEQVEVFVPDNNFYPELLRAENPRNIQGSPFRMFAYRHMTPEDEKSSTGTDERIPERSAKAPDDTYPDLDEDILPRSDHFSESNYTTGTTENSLLEDNDEEGPGETSVEDAEELNFEQFSSLVAQSQSAVAFNRLVYTDPATTSKSLNTFWVFMNPKLTKVRQSKRQK